ncbi:uncharacterized protein EDB91DRAFT_1085464 [Suillus paluster]|uniref:uncharacterized protein n=1 Tax=Suillus paluster TaxID=48578 RepID=UPI001B8697C8|nr:uncharacterized protein EDB91DRAFT_1085464 [Suillus paluster]KAG1730409.1 hypothetical protein EDB91DRAFT_1085464 [Suillus paluster]
MTAWELEESEQFTTFLDAVHNENKSRLLFNEEELKQIRNVFSDCSQDQIDDDMNYLQAIYDDNMDDDEDTNDDDDDEGDNDIDVDGLYISYQVCVSPYLLCRRCSQRKGKAAVPKPARGSGLNPSGMQQQGQPSYEDKQGQGGLSYGHAQGPSLYGHAQGPSPYGHAQGLSLYGDAQGPLLYGDTQGPSLYGAGQGPSLDTDNSYDFYEHFQDALLNSGPLINDYPDTGPSDYAEGATPVPQ